MSTAVCKRHRNEIDEPPWECSDRERIDLEKAQTRASRKGSRESPSALVVEKFLKSLKETAKIASVVGKLPALKAIATELFDAVEDLEVVDDPDAKGVRYFTITVHASGDVRSAVNLRKEWHRRVFGLLGEHYDLVHLAIDLCE